MAGLDFLDLLAGYDRTIIIDAIQTGKGVPGQIYRLGPEILAGTRHATIPTMSIWPPPLSSAKS